jgi:hypothetical protein
MTVLKCCYISGTANSVAVTDTNAKCQIFAFRIRVFEHKESFDVIHTTFAYFILKNTGKVMNCNNFQSAVRVAFHCNNSEYHKRVSVLCF